MKCELKVMPTFDCHVIIVGDNKISNTTSTTKHDNMKLHMLSDKIDN